MEVLADAIQGPGMGTSITYIELRGLLDALHEAEAEAARAVKSAERKTGRSKKAVEEPSWSDALVEVIPALADILEGHPELWGQSAVDALAAWAEQQNIEVPATWRPAVEKALGGGK